MNAEGFYKLLRAHDYVWRDKTRPLAVRITACNLLWNTALTFCSFFAGREKTL